MDTEQFGQLLEMIGQAGDGAFAIAIIYMAVGFAKGLVAPAAWLMTVVVASRLTWRCVEKNFTFDEERVVAERIASLDWYRREYPHTVRKEAEEKLAAADAETG